MRALAEFILRGRLQATAVALIGNWVPLLTPATVALVTLRVGRNNGLLILLWGVLPSLLLLGFSQIAPAVATAVVGGVVITYAAALFLGRGLGWATCLNGGPGDLIRSDVGRSGAGSDGDGTAKLEPVGR